MSKKEEKENIKKSSPVLVTILIVLLFGVFLGFGFGLGGASIIKQVNNNSIGNEDIYIDSDIVLNLFNTFRIDKSCPRKNENLNTSDLLKLRIAYENISRQNIEIRRCDEIFPELELYCNYNINVVDAKVIEAKVHELFGSDYVVKHESFEIDADSKEKCHYMNYYQDFGYVEESYPTEKYKCEGVKNCILSTQTILSAKIKKGKLIISTELKSDNSTENIVYIFKKDKVNGNYVFEKIVKE